MMSRRVSTYIKLNYCSAADLLQLKGVGPKRAKSIIRYRKKKGPFLTMDDLSRAPGLTPEIVDENMDRLDWSFNGHRVEKPKIFKADARRLKGIPERSIDLVITSPPYWKKRDYEHGGQIGQEQTPEAYIDAIAETVDSWIPLLRPHASVFLNIGDTYRDGTLVGIPELLAISLRRRKWLLVNKIIWAKANGTPEPLRYRLANRHEMIFQIARRRSYFTDVNALASYLNQSSNPGDVWQIPPTRSRGSHLAPFPEELVKRIIEFACPEHVCSRCGKPYLRRLHPTKALDTERPQARRASELFERACLTEAHLKAIRAVGISDAGKGRKIQTGAGANAARTQKLAREAKEALGGYFREFTFAPKLRADWSVCSCNVDTLPGTVLDPFMGSGTTLKIAHRLGRRAIGADLVRSATVL